MFEREQQTPNLHFCTSALQRGDDIFLYSYSTTPYHCMAIALLPIFILSPPSHLCRSARRNGAYSEEPDGGLLLELALNPPPLRLSSESVRDSRPVVAPMLLEDGGGVAGKGKSALPAVVLDLPPSSPTLSSGPRYQGQVV